MYMIVPLLQSNGTALDITRPTSVSLNQTGTIIYNHAFDGQMQKQSLHELLLGYSIAFRIRQLKPRRDRRVVHNRACSAQPKFDDA